MNADELNFYVNTLQNKMTDYFTQSIVLESKIAYQNDIIRKQNERIAELEAKLEPKKPIRKKADGGEF